MDNHTPLKRCSKCGVEKPLEDFYKKYAKCKTCVQSERRQYKLDHPEEHRAKVKQWRANGIEKIKAGKRRHYLKHRDEILKKRQEYRDNNREEIRRRQREIYATDIEFRKAKSAYRSEQWKLHKDSIKEKRRDTLERTRSYRLERGRQYYKNNADSVKEKTRNRRVANPRVAQIERISKQRRRAKIRNLPATFTSKQWESCVEWWQHKCCYCGEIKTLTLDHFIPIMSADCPGTTMSNIIPACFSCNSSKQDANAEYWLGWKFGERQAKKILQRIEQYFEWVKNRS